MSKAILLDSGPLGLATNPAKAPEVIACNQWIKALADAGVIIYVPEITDYEVRRELLRARKTAGIARLDALKMNAHYLPITTDAILLAAQLWARARQQGHQTAADSALDANVILAAQAIILGADNVMVASDNVRHLRRFVNTEEWQNITLDFLGVEETEKK